MPSRPTISLFINDTYHWQTSQLHVIFLLWIQKKNICYLPTYYYVYKLILEAPISFYPIQIQVYFFFYSPFPLESKIYKWSMRLYTQIKSMLYHWCSLATSAVCICGLTDVSLSSMVRTFYAPMVRETILVFSLSFDRVRSIPASWFRLARVIRAGYIWDTFSSRPHAFEVCSAFLNRAAHVGYELHCCVSGEWPYSLSRLCAGVQCTHTYRFLPVDIGLWLGRGKLGE